MKFEFVAEHHRYEYYTIEAESLEKAKEIFENGDIEPVNYETDAFELLEILDEKENVLWKWDGWCS